MVDIAPREDLDVICTGLVVHLKRADDAFYRSDHPDAKLSERVRCKADWIGLSPRPHGAPPGAILSVLFSSDCG